jgi:curved DNA-binding protein CbpA
MFAEVSEAFFLLSNEAKRKEYDQLIESTKKVVSQPAPPQPAPKSEFHHYAQGNLSEGNTSKYELSLIAVMLIAVLVIVFCVYLLKDSDYNHTNNSASTTTAYSVPTPIEQPINRQTQQTQQPDAQGELPTDPIQKIDESAKKGYDDMIIKGINTAIAKQATESWVKIQLGSNPNVELPIHRVGINEFQKIAQRAQKLYNEDVNSGTYPDKALQSAISFIKNQAQFYNTDNTKVQSLDAQEQNQ